MRGSKLCKTCSSGARCITPHAIIDDEIRFALTEMSESKFNESVAYRRAEARYLPGTNGTDPQATTRSDRFSRVKIRSRALVAIIERDQKPITCRSSLRCSLCAKTFEVNQVAVEPVDRQPPAQLLDAFANGEP